MADILGESEETLIARGVAYAREYAAVVEKPTILAKNLAAVSVALRIKHGDMVGSSYAYRQEVSDLYTRSGVEGETLDRLKAAVRYHIGNTLRRQMTTRELRRHGLLETSPLERLQDSRRTNSALVAAVKASQEASSIPSPKSAKARTVTGTQEAVVQPPATSGADVKATADHLRLAHVAGNIVRQMDTDVIDEHMTEGQRAKLDEELAALQKTITQLRKHTRKRRSTG
ncbi:hypothetical protein NPS70_16470 [Streptomyces sp. C10-9-1]|uniref:hypothetical protein n=1 Tax=Streptomyces sp. C10-9-1 TaxID=1859285 RepID=UPI0021118D5E|nr:hypothetical protein [Streptomyces sp. C10-9-1]MCQ6554781.1 hypothetical protein [Streptomyces sp. C10-9-1]